MKQWKTEQIRRIIMTVCLIVLILAIVSVMFVMDRLARRSVKTTIVENPTIHYDVETDRYNISGVEVARSNVCVVNVPYDDGFYAVISVYEDTFPVRFCQLFSGGYSTKVTLYKGE